MADDWQQHPHTIQVREALEYCFSALCEDSWTCAEAEQLYFILELFGLEADCFMWCHAMTDDEGDQHVPVRWPAQWTYRDEGESNDS